MMEFDGDELWMKQSDGDALWMMESEMDMYSGRWRCTLDDGI